MYPLWAPEPLWTLWIREKSPADTSNEASLEKKIEAHEFGENHRRGSCQSLCEPLRIELPSFSVTSLPCLSLNFRVAMISLSSRSLGDKLRVAPGSWTSKSWPRTYCSTSLRTSSSTLLTSSVEPFFSGLSEFRTIATASDTCSTDNNQLT